MPYIKQSDRDEATACGPSTPGELNYAITSLVHNFVMSDVVNYSAINEAIGVLECAKLELYRMVAAPYEDIKRKENGPVSELDSDDSDKEKTD